MGQARKGYKRKKNELRYAIAPATAAELRNAATDEYDAYVDPIVQMILASKRLEALEAYLFNTETQAMGQKPIHSRATVAAQILSDLENEFADRH